MLLTVIIDDQTTELNLPPNLITQADDFFQQMDADMAKGWQMSREWVEQPNQTQRAQIVADKLLTALENHNRKLALLMAGYLLSRLPNLTSIDINTSGEISETQLNFAESTAEPPPPAPASTGLSKLDALEQAGRDVTKVFRVGKQYRFSTLDHATGNWQDSPAIDDKTQAEQLRQEAYKARYEQLLKQ